MIVARLEPYFFLALLLGAFLLAFFILKPFLGPLLLAAAVAAIFYPIYTFILARLGGAYKNTAAFLTVLLCIACVLLPLLFLGTRLVSEAEELYQALAGGAGKAHLDSALLFVEQSLAQYVPGSEGAVASLSENIDTYVRSGLTWLLGYLGAIFSGIAILLLKTFIFLIALYYLLRDGASLKRKIIALSPLADDHDRGIFNKLKLAVNSVVRGTLMIAAIQGVLTAIGFIIFGVPNAVLWGTIAAVAALIPGFGTALVIVPAVIYLFIVGNMIQAVLLLVWGAFAVGLIDNFLGPKLMGHGTELHPLLVMLSVLGGIVLFGPLGIFLGPLTLSFLFALLSIYAARKIEG
jgi:predicted PurR-regulated permease PerM